MVRANRKEAVNEALYQLDDACKFFDISRVELMKAAENTASAIKLCIRVPDNITLHTLDLACLQSASPEEKDKLIVYPNHGNHPHISEEQNFDQKNIIALIVSPETCKDCLRFGYAHQMLFQEAYAKPRSYSDLKSDDVRLLKPTWYYPIDHNPTEAELNRLRFAYYRNPKINFYQGLGYEDPEKNKITPNILMIYGSELNRFMELNRELKLRAVSNPKVKNENLTAIKLGQETFKRLVEEMQERLTKKSEIIPSVWPGVELDITALAYVWGKHKNFPHLLKATTTLRDYRRGILTLKSGSEQTDFYINLFSEYKDEIIKERESLIMKKKKEEKTKSLKENANFKRR